MKKLIYAGLAVLLALSFAACGSATGGPNETKGGDDTQTVTYGYENGRVTSVTLSLDGKGGSRSVARALSKDIAQEAYNFYEVAFTNGTDTARASWSFGETVSISGVPRGTAADGINYSLTGGTGAPVANFGYAILFVGRKSTEGGPTLLAIGKITAVDDVTGTTVKPDSKSVTFGLSAFTGNAGTSFASTDTNYANVSTPLNGYTLNVHKFDPGVGCTATYTLGTSAGTNFPIAAMLAGVDTTATSTYEKFSTKSPVLNNAQLTSYKGPIIEDSGRSVSLIPSGVINIGFTTKTNIISAGGNVGLVSFYFNIPVRAISGVAGVGTPTIPPKTWFIRPGLDLGEVDYGVNSIGAGILISNGNPYTEGLLIVVGGAIAP